MSVNLDLGFISSPAVTSSKAATAKICLICVTLKGDESRKEKLKGGHARNHPHLLTLRNIWN